MIRSGLWEPERGGPIDALPTYAQALKDHGKLTVPEADTNDAYCRTPQTRCSNCRGC